MALRHIPLRNFNGWMLDKNTSAGADLLILTGGVRDSFEIDGGLRDDKQIITGYGCYTESYDSS